MDLHDRPIIGFVYIFTPSDVSSGSRFNRDLAQEDKSLYDIAEPEWRVLIHVGYSNAPLIRHIERPIGSEKPKVSHAASKQEAMEYLFKHVAYDRLIKASADTQ